MSPDTLENDACEQIRALVTGHGPVDPRIVHCEAETDWFPDLLRTVSEHRMHVLDRGPDLIVFLDEAGLVTGWRDDGRRGAEYPGVVDEQAFLEAVKAELGLPAQTRLSRIESRELPPLGWAHHAILLLEPVPCKESVVTVWADPKNLKVIQLLQDSDKQHKAGNDSPEEQKKTAEEKVKDLFSKRLERAGISSSCPGRYFHAESTEPEPFPGGFQVRVKTWRHWSDAFACFDAESREPMGWSVHRFADPANQEELTREEALQAARSLIPVPEDARLTLFQHIEHSPGSNLVLMEWERVFQDHQVEGDYLRILFHPSSRCLVELRKKWRDLALSGHSGRVSREQAIERVLGRMKKLDIHPDMRFVSANKAVVEYKRIRERPGSVDDRLAWIVELVSSQGWVKVHVDASTGKELSIIRSA